MGDAVNVRRWGYFSRFSSRSAEHPGVALPPTPHTFSKIKTKNSPTHAHIGLYKYIYIKIIILKNNIYAYAREINSAYAHPPRTDAHAVSIVKNKKICAHAYAY